MKKTIYYCDACGVEIPTYDQEVTTHRMPRRVRVVAKGGRGDALLAVVGKRVSLADTHICDKCAFKLADMFNVIEDEGI